MPKVARVAGLGIIKLAQASGRPIYPSAIATSRRYVVNNWDRTTINLPFGRGAGVAAEPISVPADADDAGLEAARRLLEDRLNAATRRAYELVDQPAAMEFDVGESSAVGIARLSAGIRRRLADGAAGAGAPARSRQGAP